MKLDPKAEREAMRLHPEPLRPRPPKAHHLKSWPENYQQVNARTKVFEVRKNDRDFAVGDILVLHEFIPSAVTRALCGQKHNADEGAYTGDSLLRMVIGITSGNQHGIFSTHVVLSLRELTSAEQLYYANIMEPQRTPPPAESVPVGVYWSEEGDNFYDSDTMTGLGDAFYRKWRARWIEFPQKPVPSPDNVSEAAGEPVAPQRLDDQAKDWIKDSAMAFEVNPAVTDEAATNHELVLLTHLIQECSEVTKAATKLMLFGHRAHDNSTGKFYDNQEKLGFECGNLLHMINVVAACDLVLNSHIGKGERAKQAGLLVYLPKGTE